MHGHEILYEEPLVDNREDGEQSELRPLGDFIDQEKITDLTNLFDELAKKYEGMNTTSENGLDFAEELSSRIDEIFEGRQNRVCEAVKNAFGQIGMVCEADLGFTYDKERSKGNFMSEDELKILEWFDSQKQVEMLVGLVRWQHEVMRMTQWLGMLDGGDELSAQFSERWREFAGKRLGVDPAEARLRGIAGPLLFAKLLEKAGYDAFLPEVEWDRKDEIDLMVCSKKNKNLVFAVQLKARKGGQLGLDLEDKPVGENHLMWATQKLNQNWSRNFGVNVLPLFVSMEGLSDGRVELDLAKAGIIDEKVEEEMADYIRTTLEQMGSEMEMPLAA